MLRPCPRERMPTSGTPPVLAPPPSAPPLPSAPPSVRAESVRSARSWCNAPVVSPLAVRRCTFPATRRGRRAMCGHAVLASGLLAGQFLGADGRKLEADLELDQSAAYVQRDLAVGVVAQTASGELLDFQQHG